jgi:hypothetical protein
MNLDDLLQAEAAATLEANRPAALPSSVPIRAERSTAEKERPLLVFYTENPKRPHPRFQQCTLVLRASVRRGEKVEENARTDDAQQAGVWHAAAAAAFTAAGPVFAERLATRGVKLQHGITKESSAGPDGETGWIYEQRWLISVIGGVV